MVSHTKRLSPRDTEKIYHVTGPKQKFGGDGWGPKVIIGVQIPRVGKIKIESVKVP